MANSETKTARTLRRFQDRAGWMGQALKFVGLALAAGGLASCAQMATPPTGAVHPKLGSGSQVAASAGRAVRPISATASPVPVEMARSDQSKQGFVRDDGDTPYLVAKVFYQDAATLPHMVATREDVTETSRGMRRLGSGALSVGLQSDRGRWLRVYECGGDLFVAGSPGQHYRVSVRNHLDVALEIALIIDGRDARTGMPATAADRGFLIKGRETLTFGRKPRKGRPQTLPLVFGQPPDADALFRYAPNGCSGLILVRGYLPEGHDPTEIKRTLSRHTGRDFPDRRYEPLPLPYQYR